MLLSSNISRAEENQAVYLDYNATTPVAPEVLDAIHYALKDCWGNPSSSHHYGNSGKYCFYIGINNNNIRVVLYIGAV